ncbi:MAG: EAL domain-containing protein [Kineosporiaceae bacterium]
MRGEVEMAGVEATTARDVLGARVRARRSPVYPAGPLDRTQALARLGADLIVAAGDEQSIGDLITDVLLGIPAAEAALWTLPPGDRLPLLDGCGPRTESGPDTLLRHWLREDAPGTVAVLRTGRAMAVELTTLRGPLAAVGSQVPVAAPASALRSGPGTGPVPAASGVFALLAPVPGAAGYGVVAVRHEHPFTDDDLDFATAVCRRAGVVLGSHRRRPVAAVPVARQYPTRDLVDALASRVAVVDEDGIVAVANTRWMASGTERDRCACGPVPEGADWLAHVRGSSLPGIARFAVEAGQVLDGARPAARFECRCPAAGPEQVTVAEVSALGGGTPGAVVVLSDASWRGRLEEELAHRASHDELTGLPNRAELVERLTSSLEELRGEQMLAVLFCDLDGFKDINDGLGHAVGDQVLVAVARRLRQRCRQADVVARFGGDEFVIVQPVPDVGTARTTAERLVEALAEPIVVGDAEVAPGASIGVTVVDSVPSCDDPVGALLRDADTAMYHAKERGRRRHELFDAQLRLDISARLHYASALRRAVPNDELDLLYQTRRHCGDRRLAGVEALIRWSPDGQGPVPPATFIPIAERTGRIVEVGGWALRRALADAAGLPDRRLTVAVNVSPRQLSAPHLLDMVNDALVGSGLEPRRLVLEITEGALVEDPQAAREVLTDLRRLGVSIALDDFGTGWSSMSYLRTLPVDVLKLDRTFVADLPHDPNACAVAAAVLGLGHGMGLRVVAEGVEDPRQLDILRDMGCDEYQGFIDGPPGALDRVLAVRP